MLFVGKFQKRLKLL